MLETLADKFDKTAPTIVTLTDATECELKLAQCPRQSIRSKPYLAWLRQAGWHLAIQRPRHGAGPVNIVIAAGRPNRRPA